MLSVTVTVNDAAARASLAALRQASGPQGVAQASAVAAQSVAVLIKRHLIERNMEGSGTFYGEAAESVRVDGSSVVIPRQGMHWQRFGGRIEAKPGHAMAIPKQPELKGIWPSELTQQGHAMFIWRRAADKAKGDAGNAYLAEQDGEGIRLLYLLVKAVEKGEDPTVLPDGATMAQTAASAVTAFVRRALAKAREARNG